MVTKTIKAWIEDINYISRHRVAVWTCATKNLEKIGGREEKMMKYVIKNIHTGKPLHTAEIDCKESDAESYKLRLAVLFAVERGLSLRGADLQNANLTGANLRNADLDDVKT